MQSDTRHKQMQIGNAVDNACVMIETAAALDAQQQSRLMHSLQIELSPGALLQTDLEVCRSSQYTLCMHM